MNDQPALLILSFSDIANDARVRKQVNLFAERYRVTTCGFGDPIREDVEHVQLRETKATLRHYLEALLVRLRFYDAAYRQHPRAREARRALRDRHFDAAIANDIDTLGVAFELVGATQTHADLHEFFPGLHDDMQDWVHIRKPFHNWVLTRFAARAGSATTISDAIAERYKDEFGISCGVVRNAAPFAVLSPTSVDTPIRVVHSGGAQPNRRIEVMMEATAQSTANLTLDLYLTGTGTPYLRDLHELASKLGERITIHPPVKQSELVATLNKYDVGIHILPPINTNNALALPNKFFDYVQARLAMVIGPTEGMARLLHKYDLGVIAEGFGVSQVTEVLNGLTVQKVEKWKGNAAIAAVENSSDAQQHIWEFAVAELAHQPRFD